MNSAPARESRANEEGARRRCAVTRGTGSRSGLIRFVAGPDGLVVPDITGRLCGRGLWLTAARGVIEKAVKRQVFARLSDEALKVDADLADTVERMLVRRLIDTIGLARRSGAVAIGFDQVAAWLREQGSGGALLVASDASVSQARKLNTRDLSVEMIALLTRGELGGAVGRDEVTYLGVSGGALAERLAGDAARLRGFRTEQAAREAAVFDRQGDEGYR